MSDADKEITITIKSKADTSSIKSAGKEIEDLGNKTDETARKTGHAHEEVTSFSGALGAIVDRITKTKTGMSDLTDVITEFERGGRISIEKMGFIFEGLGTGPWVAAIAVGLPLAIQLYEHFANISDKTKESAHNIGDQSDKLDAQKGKLEANRDVFVTIGNQIVTANTALETQATLQKDANNEALEAARFKTTEAKEAAESELEQQTAAERLALAKLKNKEISDLANAQTPAEKQRIQDQYDSDREHLENAQKLQEVQEKKKEYQAEQGGADAEQARLQKEADEAKAKVTTFDKEKAETLKGLQDEGLTPNRRSGAPATLGTDYEDESKKLQADRSNLQKEIDDLKRKKAQEDAEIPKIHPQKIPNDPKYAMQHPEEAADAGLAAERLESLKDQSAKDDVTLKGLQNQLDENQKQRLVVIGAQDLVNQEKSPDNNENALKKKATEDQQKADEARLKADQIRAQGQVIDTDTQTAKVDIDTGSKEDAGKDIKQKTDDALALAAAFDKAREAQEKALPKKKDAAGAPKEKTEEEKLQDLLRDKSDSEKDKVLEDWKNQHAAQATTPELKDLFGKVDQPYAAKERAKSEDTTSSAAEKDFLDQEAQRETRITEDQTGIHDDPKNKDIYQKDILSVQQGEKNDVASLDPLTAQLKSVLDAHTAFSKQAETALGVMDKAVTAYSVHLVQVTDGLATLAAKQSQNSESVLSQLSAMNQRITAALSQANNQNN